MVYFFLRYGLVCLALIGWIFFQLFYKKRPWAEVKGDAGVAFIVLGVWFAIYYFWLKP